MHLQKGGGKERCVCVCYCLLPSLIRFKMKIFIIKFQCFHYLQILKMV